MRFFTDDLLGRPNAVCVRVCSLRFCFKKAAVDTVLNTRQFWPTASTFGASVLLILTGTWNTAAAVGLLWIQWGHRSQNRPVCPLWLSVVVVGLGGEGGSVASTCKLLTTKNLYKVGLMIVQVMSKCICIVLFARNLSVKSEPEHNHITVLY